MQEMPKAKNHTVMLDNRGKLVMTGTEDVSGFNEETVSVKTSQCNTSATVRQNPNFQNSLSRCNLGADFCTAVNRISLFTCIRSGGRIAV